MGHVVSRAIFVLGDFFLVIITRCADPRLKIGRFWMVDFVDETKTIPLIRTLFTPCRPIDFDCDKSIVMFLPNADALVEWFFEISPWKRAQN